MQKELGGNKAAKSKKIKQDSNYNSQKEIKRTRNSK